MKTITNIKEFRKHLEKQQYELTGQHSACKICSWTKKSLKDQGVCYKQKFYGIKSHLCCQISPALNFCQNECVYCWRDHKNFQVENIDQPEDIIKNSILAQRKLLSGFGGNEKVNKEKLEQAQNPKNFAISLTGEVLAYPKINKLIKTLHKQNCSTFIVTNGQFPKKLEKIEPPTQLYVSVSAPTKLSFNKICKPLTSASWENLLSSLKALKKLKQKTRTCIRLTLIKGLNMEQPEKYAELIKLADPHFVEAKSYMWVGSSRERLEQKNMPRHEEVKEFAQELCKHLNYKIIDEQKESRVLLLMKKDFKDRIMKF